jgi:hypothetical protein
MRSFFNSLITASGLSGMNLTSINSAYTRAAHKGRKRVHTSDFNPNNNRWTGKLHEHKREIARRARQQQ